MYRHHHHGWGGGWGWGGGPYYGRRAGFPLFGGGWGMGGGDGLLGDLMAGGIGYMVGRQQGANQQQQQQYPPQYSQYQQPAQQYQQPVQQQYQQPAQQYQQPAQQYTPQYQQPPAAQAPDQNGQMAQLKLLGQLRASGVLTDQEFQEQKQKILNGF